MAGAKRGGGGRKECETREKGREHLPYELVFLYSAQTLFLSDVILFLFLLPQQTGQT